MGWDVLIFKLRDPHTTARELAADKVEDLGSPEVVQGKIDAMFPGIEWFHNSGKLLLGDGCILVFSVGTVPSDETNMGITAHGSGDPVTPIVALCKAYGWVAFDTSTADYLNLDDPRSDGWRKFTKFRDRVIGRD